MKEVMEELLRSIEIGGNATTPIYVEAGEIPDRPHFQMINMPLDKLRHIKADISILLFFAAMLLGKDPERICAMDLYKYLYEHKEGERG